MWWRKSLGLLGNWTTTKGSTRFAAGGRARHPVRPIGARSLRFEPLERRQLLAMATVVNGVVTYEGSPGETNDIVLSPGEVFSIQDAPDVLQRGEGGFANSDFISGLYYAKDEEIEVEGSVDIAFGNWVAVGFSVGGGYAWSKGVGIPFVKDKLPEGLIGPAPPLAAPGDNAGIGGFFQDALRQASQGVASVVAGAEVTQEDKVFYEVESSNGLVDEYRLFQAIVDPQSAISETALDNDEYTRSQPITLGTLIEGSFSATADKDTDFYKFEFTAADLGKQFAVIIDTDPDGVLADSDPNNDDLSARTALTMGFSEFDYLEPRMLVSTSTLSDGTALGPFSVTRAGTFYVSVADEPLVGHSVETPYRFVVVEATTERPRGEIESFEYTGPSKVILDLSKAESDIRVDLGNKAIIDKVEVAVGILHGDPGDLTATLISPAGTRVPLFKRLGVTFPLVTPEFSDTAIADLGDVGSTFAGEFKPQGRLGSLRGEDANGTWTLEVVDSKGNSDEGWVGAWVLDLDVETPTFAHEAAPNVPIPDGDKLTSTQDVDTPDLRSILGISVGLNINHDEDDDVKVSLESPTGTVVELFDGVGGDGDNFKDTILDTRATQNIQGRTDVDATEVGDISDDTVENLHPLLISGMGGSITDLDVTLDITHLNDEDLDVYLISPNGTEVELFTDVGAAGDNFTSTTLDDEAATAITSASAPFSDTYRPEGTLGDFDGEDPNGTWTLKIIDDTLGNAGTLQSWSLSFGAPAAPFTGRFQPSNSLDPFVGQDPTGTWKLHVEDADGNGTSGTLVDWTLTFVGEGARELAPAGEYGSGRIFSEAQTDLYVVSDSSIDVGDLVFAFVDTADTDDFRENDNDSQLTVLAADSITELGFDDNDGPVPMSQQKGGNGNVAAGAGAIGLTNQGRTITRLLEDGLEDAGVDLDGMFAITTGLDVRADDGNDRIDASKLNMGGPATLDGGDGVDTILGPGGDKVELIGGSGRDTFVFNTNFPAIVTLDGGDDFDTLLVEGTDEFDEIYVGMWGLDLMIEVNGLLATYTDFQNAGIESIVIRGLGGEDVLKVNDYGPGELALFSQGPDDRSGSLTVGNLVPIQYEGIQDVILLPLDPIASVTAAPEGRVLVLDQDPFEWNDARLNPTDLNALASTSHNPTIHRAGDEDWYLFHAPKIGVFRLDVLFEELAGLPGSGNLDAELYNAAGDLIAAGTATSEGEHVTFTAIERTDYYLRVKGAGNEAINVYDVLVIELDQLGPQVTDVLIRDHPSFDLFNPKPTAGPTPLVEVLHVTLQDLPIRADGFLYAALEENIASAVGHYRLVGDAGGVIPIAMVDVVNDPVIPEHLATASIFLHFDDPLPDDRFTLTISDSLVDPAGNRLDGESNAVEPQSPPVFPTGDGQPGGDFVARFTVDSRAEIGVWAAGSVYVDTNGNFSFDPQNPDFTNRDVTYTLGLTTDHVFAGNFAATAGGTADGFDKLAVYSRTAAGSRWLIDTTNNGVPNLNVLDPSGIIGVPVAGNFDGNAANGDEVGVFTGRQWWFDTNHDFLLSNEAPRASGIFGHPVVGNFDNHGGEDLAAWDINTNTFSLSLSSQGGGFGNPVRTAQFRPGWGLQFIGVRERPVAADMDGDGIDDLGLWVPDRGGMTPAEGAEWYFLISGGSSIATRISNNTVAFSSVPFGNDLFAQFGDEFGVPVVGNFDPPGPATTVVQAPTSPTVSASTPPAISASTPGLYDPVLAGFHLKNSHAQGGGADVIFNYGPGGNRGWQPVIGDWDGDGIDTLGLYDPVLAGFHLKNSHAQGGADIIFNYGPGGNRGWQPVVGDWDGDGIDTIGLYDPVAGGFHLKNSNTQGGGADVMFAYGPGGSRGWKPLAGDFDGDGVDTVGLFDPQTGGFHLKNSHAPAGGADVMFSFGPARAWWQPLLGDWDNDGIDTVGLYDPGTGGFHLKNSHTQGGGTDVVFSYGPANRGWVPLVGNWNGSGGSPLLAAGGESAGSPPATLLEAELESVVAAAVSRWHDCSTGAGRSAVDYVIADLPGSLLGWTESDTVYIDRTAAGHGWFVDPTPARDEEFGRIDSGRDLRALDQRAAGRMDLLTAVSHELGHTRGLEDLDSSTDSLMSGALEPGVRRMPPTADGHASSARGVAEPPAGKLSLSGNQRLGEPQTIAQHVIRLLQIDVPLPSHLEYRVTFNAAPKSSTRWSNAFIVFDYKSSTDYKFAGAFVGIDYWTIGRMTDRGYVMDKSIREQIDSGTDYKLQLVLEGSTATLKVGGVTKVSHTYDDFFQGGQLGLATLRGNARFDDLSVREL